MEMKFSDRVEQTCYRPYAPGYVGHLAAIHFSWARICWSAVWSVGLKVGMGGRGFKMADCAGGWCLCVVGQRRAEEVST